MDLIGVKHDEKGGPEDESFARPSQELVARAVANLLRSYTTRELGRYLAVLARHTAGWDFVAEERDRLLQLVHGERNAAEGSATSQAESASASSMEFTVLDRVLIEQVVRAAMQIEGSLDAMQVEDLIETTARLSEKWYRAHFHLGFMDVLLPGRVLRFDRPGDSEQRRSWYLAGVVAGLVRSHDTDGLHKLFEEHVKDLAVLIATPGGPGASIAKTAFTRLVEIGRIAECVAILGGQLSYLGLDLANEALDAATLFIRQSSFEAAKALVDALSRHSLDDEGQESLHSFDLELSRRRAQCLQAAGNFQGAEKEYREILKVGEGRTSPDLLADLGLVKGRFRSVGEVRLSEGREERIAMREALTKGEEHFRRAVQKEPGSPKGAFALAVLAYLRWSFAGEKEREYRREQAAELASAAVTSILLSEFAAVYRQLGALGQSYFMLAVTRMSSLDDVQGREAVVAWQSITDEAGKLPLSDIKVLLHAAEPYGQEISDVIAESVWEHRREEATAILIDGGPWMSRSPKLRSALVSLAKKEQTPCGQRIKLWQALIPQLIKANDSLVAEEGLSELETLAESEADCKSVLEFFLDRANYDPVWRESDAAWARVYLLRRIGRDVDCANELQRLFYIVRDNQPWEAEQIVQAAEDWKLDQMLVQQLRVAMPRLDLEASPRVEERLAAGEQVRIVFIGGNEVQARYDADVREQLLTQWPGVTVRFEHTAWSSNWGRNLDRLIALANDADAVVLLYLMRTLLGRRVRAALKKPWIPCTSMGRGGMLSSIRRAARIGLEKRTEIQRLGC